jgi:hypothetical protein
MNSTPALLDTVFCTTLLAARDTRIVVLIEDRMVALSAAFRSDSLIDRLNEWER